MNYRHATPSDYPTILELNTEAVPHVNLISEDKLQELHRQSVFFGVATETTFDPAKKTSHENQTAGFLLALDETADYESLNFQYFKRNLQSFVYVDRVVVSPNHHRTGIGSQLYQQLFESLGNQNQTICCEVNLIPPNPQSLRFHQSIGFTGVAEQQTENGSKRVQLMTRPLID